MAEMRRDCSYQQLQWRQMVQQEELEVEVEFEMRMRKQCNGCQTCDSRTVQCDPIQHIFGIEFETVQNLNCSDDLYLFHNSQFDLYCCKFYLDLVVQTADV
jgi:hypothetical protein